MVYLLYDLLLLASSLVLVPYYFLRGLKYGKMRRGVRERLGFYLPGRLTPLAGKEVLWIHAVSVGETRAAIPLIKALRKAYPKAALVLSNITETGHAVAGGVKEVDLCLFFPFDLSWAVRRVLRQVRPKMAIIVETEIWPNFVRVARDSSIPVLLVNGRISDRSFPRYRHARVLIRPVLSQFSAFCMQSAQDAERIRHMGADPARVQVTGNLKFDLQAAVPGRAEVESLKEGFRIPVALPVWVAGSTHAGEEDYVASAYRQILDKGRELLLVLVPRHPERCRSIAEMLNARKFTVRLRSQLGAGSDLLRPGEILLVDTLGEMLKLYATADLVFLGGSLVPVGGHNALEASALKKAVVFGPYMHNFKEISSLLLEAGGAIKLSGETELAETVGRLLDDPETCRTMGEGGYSLLRENAGATERTLATVRQVLGH